MLGDGVGALVVESLDSALARGANIIAEVIGGGLATDAYPLTGRPPEGEGAYPGMMAISEDAGIAVDKIDYVNAVVANSQR